jgi:hypothetical protein
MPGGITQQHIYGTRSRHAQRCCLMAKVGMLLMLNGAGAAAGWENA